MLPRVDLIKTDEFDYLLFNSNDLITNFIKNHGFWGRTESNICQILTDGMDKSIVIDAGANLGGFTLPVAQHRGPKEVQGWGRRLFCGLLLGRRLPKRMHFYAGATVAWFSERCPRAGGSTFFLGTWLLNSL